MINALTGFLLAVLILNIASNMVHMFKFNSICKRMFSIIKENELRRPFLAREITIKTSNSVKEK